MQERSKMDNSQIENNYNKIVQFFNESEKIDKMEINESADDHKIYNKSIYV